MRQTKYRMKNKLLVTLVLMAIGISGFAQQSFKYRAVLPKPQNSDFHVIGLSPQLLARANADLSDIRITAPGGKMVPYIFGNQLPSKGPQQFVPFKRIITPESDTATNFVVENNEHSTAISQLLIRLRNTAVTRTADLAGSDDLENWYAIQENIVLERTGEGANKNGIYEQMLSFPSSNYRYFRIRVSKKYHDAVAILQVGIYGLQRVEKPSYSELPGTTFAQKDSGRLSRVFIKLAADYPVNSLSLTISGSKFYKRSIRLYQVRGKYRNLLLEGTVSSASDNYLRLSTKTTDLELEIDNGDNPPVTVTGVELSMLQQSLIAYLEKGIDYSIVFGGSTLAAPSYDLKFFTDSLQRSMPYLSAGSVQKNGPNITNQTTGRSVIPSLMIWVAIISVLALLIYLTIKMAGEVKKRE